jgi:plastocyanin
MRKVIMLALVSGMTIVAPDHAAARVAAAQHAVTQKNLQFNPYEMTIAVGDTVTWTNHEVDGQTIHSVVQSGGSEINSPDIPPEASFSWTFTQVQDYNIVCRFHPDMFMTLHVLAPKPAAPAAKDTKKASGKHGHQQGTAKPAKTKKPKKAAITKPMANHDGHAESAAKSKPAPAPGPPESTIPGIAGLPFAREGATGQDVLR